MTARKPRNNLVELMRWLFSLLVMGFHAQEAWYPGTANFYQNGCLAVEFFFLISGYFMARSLEKLRDERIGRETFGFLKGKIASLFPVHIAADLGMIAVLFFVARDTWVHRLVEGIPSLFLAQMLVVWRETIDLIEPEWYISAMLICMTVMAPLALLFRKKAKGARVPLLLIGAFVAAFLPVFILLRGKISWNLMQDARAYVELAIGMLAFQASKALKERERIQGKGLYMAEICGYGVPLLIGFLPIDVSLQPVCMVICILFVFAALSVTFSGKGLRLRHEGANRAFGALGRVSLMMYLFHPVALELISGCMAELSPGMKTFLLFAITFLWMGLYGVIRDRIASGKAVKRA